MSKKRRKRIDKAGKGGKNKKRAAKREGDRERTELTPRRHPDAPATTSPLQRDAATRGVARNASAVATHRPAGVLRVASSESVSTIRVIEHRRLSSGIRRHLSLLHLCVDAFNIHQR